MFYLYFRKFPVGGGGNTDLKETQATYLQQTFSLVSCVILSWQMAWPMFTYLHLCAVLGSQKGA